METPQLGEPNLRSEQEASYICTDASISQIMFGCTYIDLYKDRRDGFGWGYGARNVRHTRRVLAKAKPDRQAFGLRLQRALSRSAVRVAFLDPSEPTARLARRCWPGRLAIAQAAAGPFGGGFLGGGRSRVGCFSTTPAAQHWDSGSRYIPSHPIWSVTRHMRSIHTSTRSIHLPTIHPIPSRPVPRSSTSTTTTTVN